MSTGYFHIYSAAQDSVIYNIIYLELHVLCMAVITLDTFATRILKVRSRINFIFPGLLAKGKQSYYKHYL